MISLTIGELDKMSRREADTLRAIADIFHPAQRNDKMDVAALKSAIARGNAGALETLNELNGAVPKTEDGAASGEVTTSFTAKLYKWSKSVPSAPIGHSIYNVRAGVNSAYDGTDGWCVEALPASGADMTLYCAERKVNIPGTCDVALTDYRGAIVTPMAYHVGSPSSLGDAVLMSYSGGTTPTISTGSVTITDAVGEPTLADLFTKSVQKTAERVGGTVKATTLHPHDNPAVGAPDQHALADQVFGGGVANLTSENVAPDPAAVFSGGGLPALASAPVGTQIDSVVDPATGVMKVTGVTLVGNAPASTPIPPPLPVVTSQTSPQQSPAATNASPPPPPPLAPAPAAASGAAPTTSNAPSSVEVDKTGLPWDARIHAGTKTMTAKGVWTRRRGIEDAVFNEVEAQLRAAMAIPAPAPTSNPWPFPTDSSSVGGAAVTPPPVAAFPAMMEFITERIGTQRLTKEQVDAAVRSTGLESLNLVMSRPDLIPAIMEKLREVAP